MLTAQEILRLQELQRLQKEREAEEHKKVVEEGVSIEYIEALIKSRVDNRAFSSYGYVEVISKISDDAITKLKERGFRVFSTYSSYQYLRATTRTVTESTWFGFGPDKTYRKFGHEVEEVKRPFYVVFWNTSNEYVLKTLDSALFGKPTIEL